MTQDKPGLYVIDSVEAKRIAEEYSHDGWRVIFSLQELHPSISFTMRFAVIAR
ncbi:hypothetical protein [Burkholderia cepacia]|uniref:hypothetical protein n=1 Tax=Burkholderia cepacia TaxID=292 RepID=UPI00298FB669|nr:hypothetical protein [Burkholderia cepacia]